LKQTAAHDAKGSGAIVVSSIRSSIRLLKGWFTILILRLRTPYVSAEPNMIDASNVNAGLMYFSFGGKRGNDALGRR